MNPIGGFSNVGPGKYENDEVIVYYIFIYFLIASKIQVVIIFLLSQ